MRALLLEGAMRWIAVRGLVAAVHGAAGPALAREDWPKEWTPGRVSSGLAENQALAETEAQAEIEALGEVPAPARIEAPRFRLQVPFRTQKDGGRWQGSNCGPAALGMVLDGFGMYGQATDDLRWRAHTYQGTAGARGGTKLEHIAQVAEDFGISTHGLIGADGQFRTWSVDDIRDQLRLGRPVMPLVRLYLLPGYGGSGTRWGHYILITGLTEDGFFYSDPLKPDAPSGANGFASADQLMAAIQASHIPGQAVSFGEPLMAAWRAI